MSTELYERVENVFRGLLTEEQFEAFGPEATMDDVDGWDSLSFLNVVLELEGEFGVRIDGLDAANLVTVPNIIAYLNDNL